MVPHQNSGEQRAECRERSAELRKEPSSRCRNPAAGTARLLALRTQRHSHRRGFTLVEMVVTAVLLSAVFIALVPLLGQVNTQRRAAEQRQFALQEAANILERFSAQPWQTVTGESASRVALSDDTQQLLREPQVTVTVNDASGTPSSPAAKRITVEVRWKNRVGDFVAPVRLTTWVYRHEEPRP